MHALIFMHVERATRKKSKGMFLLTKENHKQWEDWGDSSNKNTKQANNFTHLPVQLTATRVRMCMRDSYT